MQQVFLDTNVIIDYLGNRTGFYDDAAIIMSLAINQKIKLYAAAISFATASYILSKNNDNNRIKTLRFFSNFGTFMYLSLRRPLSAKEKSMLFHP